MKKCMMMIAIAALAAGSAFAEEGEGGAQPQKGKAWNRDGAGGPPCAQMDKRGGKGGPMSPEMKAQMRAVHQEIRALGQAARAVTNEAAQAEIVAQLRAKLGEVSDRMQKHQEERLAQAEERLVGLKAKIEESKANRDSRIEEQIQRILSGERPPQSDAFKRFPHAKGGQGGGEGEYRGDKDRGPRGKGKGMRGEEEDEEEDKD